MMKSPLIEKIERALAPTAESLGYELVRILLIGSGKPTLQIMAEKPDGTMGVEDCEALSKAASALLDVENVMDGAYFLEISSPGIDRPLTRLKDFEKYKGFDARVEIEPGIGAQKKFKGKLLGVEGAMVQLQDENGTHALPFRDVQRAKLLLTDELLKEAQKKKEVGMEGQRIKISGNALFLILIAVALFAALSYAITQSSRGGGGAGREKAKLIAARMISFGDSVRAGVQRLTLTGTNVEDIDFAQNGAGTDALFARDGGGVAWQPAPPEGYSGTGANYDWNFEPPSYGWSALGVGTASEDGFFWVYNVDDNVCKAINELMRHPYEIPVDPDGGPVMEAYSGEEAFCYQESGQPSEFIYVYYAQ